MPDLEFFREWRFVVLGLAALAGGGAGVYADMAVPELIAEVSDGDGRYRLDGASSVAFAGMWLRDYAVVTTTRGDGIQLVDITEPASPRAVSYVRDGDEFDCLDGARNPAVFTLGHRTYVAVAAFRDDGVQIVDITLPYLPEPVSSIFDGEEFDRLDGAQDLAAFTLDSKTYLAVTAFHDDGVQIVDVTVPYAPRAVSSMSDGSGDFDTLDGAKDVVVAEVGGRTYLLVTAFHDDGVQIVDVTDPAMPSPAAGIADGEEFSTLNGAWGVDAVSGDSGQYALVTAFHDDGVQIVDISDPKNPAPVASIVDGEEYAELYGPHTVDAFDYDGGTFAMVVSHMDGGIQIIDVTDPEDPSPAGAASHGHSLQNMRYPWGGVVVESAPVALVASHGRLHIMNVTPAFPDTMAAPFHPRSASFVSNETLLLDARNVKVFDAGYGVYSVVAGRDGIRIVDVNDPRDIRLAGAISGMPGLDEVRGIDTVQTDSGVYVLAGSDMGLWALDVADPASPSAVDILPYPGVSDIAAFPSGRDAYAAVSGNHSIGVVHVGEYARLNQVASVKTAAPVVGLDTILMDSGTYLLAADAVSLHVFNVTAPDSPERVSVFDRDKFDIRGVAAATVGSHWYALLPWARGVSIVNVTDPSYPGDMSSISDTRCTLGAVFTSCPVALTPTVFPVLGGARDVAAATVGDDVYALVAADDGVSIINITDPVAPALVSSLSDTHVNQSSVSFQDRFPVLGGASSVDVANVGAGTYALVAARLDHGLHAVEIDWREPPGAPGWTFAGSAPGAPLPPDRVGGLTATPGTMSPSIIVSWDEPDGRGAAVTHYVVETRTGPDSWGILEYGHRTTTYVHAGLAPSSTHTYRVSASGPAGTGDPSPPATASVFGVPGRVSGLAASVNGTAVGLSWNEPSSNGTAITGYGIERKTVSNAWATISGSHPSTAYTDAGLSPGTLYFYRVSAANPMGTGSPSAEVIALTATPPTPLEPDTVSGLSAVAVNGTAIALTWNAPADNGSPILVYVVEGTDGTGPWGGVGNSTTTSYTHAGLTPSTAYTYRVSAVNGVGMGMPSANATATTNSS